MRTIPSYELYGELLSGSLQDPIHHEPIKDRSSQHDWTIRVHRHRNLAQIFLLRSLGVSFRLGDVEHISTEPVILVIPSGVPHGFLFPEEALGDVLSIRLDEIPADTRTQFEHLSTPSSMIFAESETDSFENVAALIRQLDQAYHSISGTRTEVLTTLINLITLYLIGDTRRKNTFGQASVAGHRGRQELKVEEFCSLLEDHFQKSWVVADYAERLKISAPHLTRMCRTILGSTPNNLVRQRRLVEAKRLLEYTGLSIAEIAHRCGFRDAAFFSRTFKSNIGMTPKTYRTNLAPRSFNL